jgi:phosphate transport system permease protein
MESGLITVPQSRRRVMSDDPRDHARGRRAFRPWTKRPRALLGAIVLAVYATTMALPGQVALAAGTATLSVNPAAISAGGGDTFTFDIVQNATVPTSGAQMDLAFDPAKLQVMGVKPGPAYAGGLFLFGSSDDGTNKSLDVAMKQANDTGRLNNLATFLLPGSGIVPPGDAVFLTITMKALPGKGGTANLGILTWTMLDQAGEKVTTQALNGAVTIGAATATAGAGASPAASGLASPGPSGSTTDTVDTPVDWGLPTGPATVSVAPASVDAKQGGTTVAYLVARATTPSSAVTVDLTFDPKLLQVTTLEPGPAWTGASILAGGTGGVAQTIALANQTGQLKQTGVYLLPTALEFPAQESIFLVVTLKEIAAGTSPLSITAASVLDSKGTAVAVDASGFTAVKAPPSTVDPALVVGVLVLVAAVVLLSVFVRRMSAQRRRRWPYAVSLILGLIPVMMFVAIVAMLVGNALPVVASPGIPALFSGKFTSAYSLGGITGDWGLVPAVWGTIEITVIAVLIALPVSLAMAVIAAEFPMGPLGRLIRPLLGVLSGIPPIVFAVAGAVFVTVFIAPKFAGSADFSSFHPEAIGAAAGSWPPADVPWSATAFPWPPNSGGLPSSTLLGGVLIALLVIPFMAPLIYDAMRAVPRATREASLALGANRSYTLRRVIIPQAMPGIVAAVALATLKALGDVLIVAFVVGWQAESLPTPLADVLERTSSLAVEGANLLGSLQSGAGQYCDAKTPACAVGYSSALVLLLVAAVVVTTATLLERRMRRRLVA